MELSITTEKGSAMVPRQARITLSVTHGHGCTQGTDSTVPTGMTLCVFDEQAFRTVAP